MRRGLRAAQLGLLLILAGCASVSTTIDPQQAHWRGKLAVKILGTPIQAFNAGFDLQGSAQEGLLILNSPLGTTLARLQWSPGHAYLRSGSEERQYHSLDALARQATGATIPIAGLFAWLQGHNETNGNWRADLSELQHGKLLAHSTGEDPPAELKIILEP